MSGAGASGLMAVRAAGAPALATTGPEARPGNDTLGDQPAVRKIVRGVQISLRTISGVLHRSTSIFIVALIERISTSPSHLRSYNSPICLPPTDGSRIVVTTLNCSTRLS